MYASGSDDCTGIHPSYSHVWSDFAIYSTLRIPSPLSLSYFPDLF